MIKSEFYAWSQSYSDSPIRTQTFALHPQQSRQYIDWYPKAETFDFARANRGHLYIVGDEPDQEGCMAVEEYAAIYHNAVEQVRAVDPTARFSPAGFAEPNLRCCAADATYAEQADKHSVAYAQRFYDSYIKQFGAPPSVAEWRFHDFALSFGAGDVAGWWSRVSKMAEWSVQHGAKMVLASWGFLGWNTTDVRPHLFDAMQRLVSDDRIVAAVWWSKELWLDTTHPLVTPSGQLTSLGETYTGKIPENTVPELSDNERIKRIEENVGDYTKGAFEGTNNIDRPNGEATIIKSLKQLHIRMDELFGADGKGGVILQMQNKIQALEKAK